MEVLGGILLSVVVGLAIGSAFVDFAELFRIERIVNWVQRVVFGIGQPVIGPEALIGETAVVLNEPRLADDGINHTATATIGHEIWTIRCPEPFEIGQSMRVERANGAILDVVADEQRCAARP